MKTKREKIQTTIEIILLPFILWIAISIMIQAFKCPQMTSTQLILNIPHSFVCDFKECE